MVTSLETEAAWHAVLPGTAPIEALERYLVPGLAELRTAVAAMGRYQAWRGTEPPGSPDPGRGPTP